LDAAVVERRYSAFEGKDLELDADIILKEISTKCNRQSVAEHVTPAVSVSGMAAWVLSSVDDYLDTMSQKIGSTPSAFTSTQR
jgi:hypothetical protein